MKILKLLTAFVISLSTLMAVPAPSEYEYADFERFVRKHNLIVEGTVIDLDTTYHGSERSVYARISVDSIYKGFIDSTELTLAQVKDTLAIGGYEYEFEKYESSIFGLSYSSYTKQIQTSALTKFDISGDVVVAPPTGKGFAEDMKYCTEVQDMRNRIRRIIEKEDLIQLVPFIPYEFDTAYIKMSINISGGAVLEQIVFQENGLRGFNLTAVIEPCEGICPLNYEILDTTVAFPVSKPGRYYVYKKSIMNYSDGEIERLHDTLQFEITEVHETGFTATSIEKNSELSLSSVDGNTLLFAVGSANNITNLDISDMKGRIIWSGSEENIQNGLLRWDRNSVANGIYFLTVNTNMGRNSLRFSVK